MCDGRLGVEDMKAALLQLETKKAVDQGQKVVIEVVNDALHLGQVKLRFYALRGGHAPWPADHAGEMGADPGCV